MTSKLRRARAADGAEQARVALLAKDEKDDDDAESTELVELSGLLTGVSEALLAELLAFEDGTRGDAALENGALAKKSGGCPGCTPRRRIQQRPRVPCRTLRVPVPLDEELEAASAAEAAVQQAAAQPPESFWYPACDDRDLTACEMDTQPSKSSHWRYLQKNVRGKYEKRIEEELGAGVMLEPIHPDREVRSRFRQACRSNKHKLMVGYHGTKEKNIGSIARRGLLVPNHEENGVKVANGSAHGVGVYTAQLGSASLSLGFCDSRSLFVCAICDTSRELGESETWTQPRWTPSSTVVQTVFPVQTLLPRRSNHKVTRGSEEVIHAGSAMVVFDERFVVPLFLCTLPPEAAEPDTDAGAPPKLRAPAPLPRRHWEAPQQVGRRRIAVPLDGCDGVLFPQARSQRQGDTVWLTPKPLASRSAHDREVKRRATRRREDGQRRKCREWKLFWQEVHAPLDDR
mmetsp:Transcript_60376/g.155606  ORF Transcript_60376/g.155606 Transcript_60376/m.155606 type:complete len:459 (+) Transcript_60376:72-1448(+)